MRTLPWTLWGPHMWMSKNRLSFRHHRRWIIVSWVSFCSSVLGVDQNSEPNWRTVTEFDVATRLLLMSVWRKWTRVDYLKLVMVLVFILYLIYCYCLCLYCLLFLRLLLLSCCALVSKSIFNVFQRLIDWWIVDMNLDTTDLNFLLKTHIYESHTKNLLTI